MAAIAAGLTGCCCEPWGGCYPNGNNWCGSCCGESMWHEWFSIPPECCDPCDCCGSFIGPRLNDGLYSHGNDYHGWCEKRDAGKSYVGLDDVPGQPNQFHPAPGEDPAPTPAEEPYYEEGVDEMTYQHSPRSKYPARRLSYDQQQASRGPRAAQRPPMQRSPMQHAPSMQRPQTQRLFSALSQPQVDSRGPSRTLARPQRARLFSQFSR